MRSRLRPPALRRRYGHPYHPARAPASSGIAVALGCLAPAVGGRGRARDARLPAVVRRARAASTSRDRSPTCACATRDGELVVQRRVAAQGALPHAPAAAARALRASSASSGRATATAGCSTRPPTAARGASGSSRGGLTDVRVTVRPGRGCTMSRSALPARFPPSGARAGGAALPAAPRRHQLVGAGRQLGPAARLRAAPRVREREPREGDAARGVPAPDRQPHAGRRRAGVARADDHELVERRGRHDLLPRRRRRALRRRAAGRDDALLGGRLLGQRALQRGGPGAPLQPDRPAGAEGARARTRAGCCRRSSPTSAGASRATRSRAGFKTFFKGGWRGTGAGQLVHEAALFERGDTRVSMAVLTDGNPSHEYGTETLRGVAQSACSRSGRGRGSRPAAARTEGGSPGAPRRAGPRRRAPLRPRHPRPPLLPHEAQRDGPAAARLLRELGAACTSGPRSASARCSATCAAAASGCWSSTPTAPCAPPRRSSAGRSAPAAAHLVGTYIARRSRHNTGSAVDITLVRHRDGKRLRMGGFALGPELAHLQRVRAHPAQPAHAQERDGALRLQRLPQRVVALRAPHSPEPLSRPDARLRPP